MMISTSYTTYDLILILLSAAALLKVYPHWQRRKYPQAYRMVLGLSLLILIRIILLIMASLSWKGQQFSPSFNVLSNTGDILSIMLIFWMWVFPEPEQASDLSFAGAAVLIGFVSLLQLLFVPSSKEVSPGITILWELFFLVVLIACGFLIRIRKPNQYETGMLMVGIFGTGLITTWLLPSPDQFALTPTHLAQLAGYPFLLVLVNRFHPQEEEIQIASQLEENGEELRRKTSVDYPVMVNIQRLFVNATSNEMLNQITRCTSEILLSDLTLLIDSPDKHGKARIIAGYDLIRQNTIQAITLIAKNIPLLANYITKGKMLHLPASSTSKDLSHLSHSLQLTSPGHLLAAPIEIPTANRRIGLVLLSPFSNRPWTKADQDYLRILIKLYNAAFHYRHQIDAEKPDNKKQVIQDLSAKISELTQDNETLHSELSTMGRELENLRWDKKNLQEKIHRFQKEQESLYTHIRMLSDLARKESIQSYRKYLGMIEKEIQQERKDRIAAEDQEPSAALPEQEKKKAHDQQSGAHFPEILEQIIQQLNPQIERKNISTSITIPDSIPPLEMAKGLFQELFSILLSNAVQTTKDTGEITIKTQIYQEDESLQFAHIKITDQCEALTQDDLNIILENQLPDALPEAISQQITNLYVTKNLIEDEGGRMWVESVPDTGAVVSLLLPLQGESYEE